MIRLLATMVRPFATLDRWLTDRRVDAARREHALDTARIEALSRGLYFRPSVSDDQDCEA